MRINSLQMMPVAQQTNKQCNTLKDDLSFKSNSKIEAACESFEKKHKFLSEWLPTFALGLIFIGGVFGSVALARKIHTNQEEGIFDNKTEKLLADRQKGVNNMFLSGIRPQDIIELKHKHVKVFPWWSSKREVAENYFNDILVTEYTDPESQQGANISWDEFYTMGDRMEIKVKQLKGEK